MNWEIIDHATEPALRIDPIRYVRSSMRRGRTHIIYQIRDGTAHTQCHSYFHMDSNPVISDKIHPRAKLCKKCQKANS